ncbi:hypothetical protein P7C71_g1881, partial [Lecanoromycetidae sp. Uapishka_2]
METAATKSPIDTERDNEFSEQMLLPHQRVPAKKQVSQEKSLSIAESDKLLPLNQDSSEEARAAAKTNEVHLAVGNTPPYEQLTGTEHTFVETKRQQPTRGTIDLITQQNAPFSQHAVETKHQQSRLRTTDLTTLKNSPDSEHISKEVVPLSGQSVELIPEQKESPGEKVTPYSETGPPDTYESRNARASSNIPEDLSSDSAALLSTRKSLREQKRTPAGVKSSPIVQPARQRGPTMPPEKKQSLEADDTPAVRNIELPLRLTTPNHSFSSEENKKSINEDGSEETLVGTATGTASSNHGPPIMTPYLPRSSVDAPFEPHPSEFEWKTVDRAKMGKLIDFSSPVEEKIHDPSATDKRVLKRTMGQKAPSHKLAGGNTALLKSFEETVARLLKMALACHGPINLAVRLGRLLIDPDKGSKEFKNKSFKASEWPSAFPTSHTVGQSALETVFTPRITTSTNDAQSILDICLSQGRKLFNLPAITWKVSYIFLCKTKDNEQITIETRENGTFKVMGSEIFVGALDWHFAKRSFDARLALNAHEPLLRDHQQQAQSIASSMKISVSDQQTFLTTQPREGELVIQSITRHRETAYTVRNCEDLLLHLREVQEFELSSSENKYRGVLQPSKEMINAEKYWYEAFITSISAAAVMSESDTLELGDAATWTPEAVINKGIIGKMHDLAKEVVANIDHIGFDNKGSKGSSGTKSTSYQKSVQSEQQSAHKDPQSIQTTGTASDSYW